LEKKLKKLNENLEKKVKDKVREIEKHKQQHVEDYKSVIDNVPVALWM
jgi:mRNA-degrading endonuclease RelE of RelBE toxin-antitoxin system